MGGASSGDVERQLGDVGRDTGRLDQGVVSGVNTSKAVTRDGDGLGRADVLVGEDPCPGGAYERDRIPSDRADGATGNRRGQKGVVGLVSRGGAGDVERQQSDVCREAGRLNQGVVAGVGAGEGVTRDSDGLARADVLVGEGAGAAGRIQGDRITCDRADGAAGNRRDQKRVVGLVGRRGAGHVERQRGDGRGHARGLDQGVVSGIGSGDGITRDGDGLGCADVLVGEEAGAVRRIEDHRVA